MSINDKKKAIEADIDQSYLRYFYNPLSIIDKQMVGLNTRNLDFNRNYWQNKYSFGYFMLMLINS